MQPRVPGDARWSRVAELPLPQGLCRDLASLGCGVGAGWGAGMGSWGAGWVQIGVPGWVPGCGVGADWGARPRSLPQR